MKILYNQVLFCLLASDFYQPSPETYLRPMPPGAALRIIFRSHLCLYRLMHDAYPIVVYAFQLGAAFILCKPAMLQQEIQTGQFFSKTGTIVSWCKTMSADSVQLQHHALSISSPHCTAVVSRLLYTPLRLLPILWVNFD